MIRLLLIVILFAFNLKSFGQKAWQKDLATGDAYMSINEYANAKYWYERALKRNNNIQAAKKLTDAYLMLREFSSALSCFTTVYYTERGNVKVMNKYASLLFQSGQYQQASSVFNEVLGIKSDSTALKGKRLCESAIALSQLEKKHEVAVVRGINSTESEISPAYYKDGLVFASSRQTIQVQPTSGQTGEPFYDLYQAEKSTGHYFKKPKPFGTGINSADHEAAVTFQNEGKEIYFTRSSHRQLRATDSLKASQRLKMYKAEKTPLGWSKPEGFMLNDSLSSFGHPSFLPEEKVFVFASDMPGGYGGTDLYICFEIDSSWTLPKNMGPNVNTDGNEMYPFLHQNGTLYFTSDGHPGLGGYDIFSAELHQGTWTNINNLGMPINSNHDDFSLIISPDLSSGYFSSNRKGGVGSNDIWMFRKK